MLERVCYSIREIQQMTGFGRTKIVADMDAGRLKARRRGRRVFVMKEDLLAWLDAQPDYLGGDDSE
jgi:hypothetical protein